MAQIEMEKEMKMTSGESFVVIVITIVLIAIAISVSGCQWDTQANNSIRFLMDGEGSDSRNNWAYGSLR